MTKEELERIKEAYYSGLKVQIWFNGHWENFDARDYSMYSDPFSENRQYRVVGSTYADIAEKRIAELNNEIAELKAYNEKLLDGDIEKHNKIVELQNRNGELAGQKASLERWLGEAKELLREIIDTPVFTQMGGEVYENEGYAELVEETEQFLKGCEKE